MARLSIVKVVLNLTIAAGACLAQEGPPGAAVRSSGSSQTIAERTKGWARKDGYFPLYWDPKAGRVYVEVNRFSSEFLYHDQLVQGVGLAGLDRAQMGLPKVVRFERSGPKVFLIAINYAWRSSSPNADERLAVRQSFPESVLWGFTVAAEGPDGAVLVDATEFFLRDAHGIPDRLATAKLGVYHLDAGRSAIEPDDTRNFPLNTVVESMLTFTSEQARGLPTFDGQGRRDGVAAVTPDPHFITVRQRQSFIQLPGPGYHPRAYDIRAGYFNSVIYFDYSAPFGHPIDTHLMMRHRLQKKNPEAAVSEPVKPIVYYVDRGTPEPIRSALVEGAGWWAQAFEAAGFKNAFKVEVLPVGADAMDIRYNMIEWVHRAIRGFSNGACVVDPRTGEIIKAEVTLGSLRDSQDYLIAEALLSPYAKSSENDARIEKMVLQRMRQLAAHEVAHTLGLGHNHAASAFGRGGSVTDYPAPLVEIDAQGNIDISHAYGSGLGEWDKVAIQYGYQEFPPGMPEQEQKANLEKILDRARDSGMYYITTQDSAQVNDVHPYSHQWDNGKDPAEELERLWKVRSLALSRFSEAAIRKNTPMALLEDALVPLYLLHRYQTEAAATEIGGLDFRYAVRGDGQMVTKIVPGEKQRKALQAVLMTLDPAALTLKESLLELLPPRPPEYPRWRESFEGRTGPTFDPLAAAETAADFTMAALFDPDRAGRLVEYHARDAGTPGLAEVIEATVKASWYAPRLKGLDGATQMTVQKVVLDHLLGLGASGTASAQVKAIAKAQAAALKNWINEQLAQPGGSPEVWAHWTAALTEINQFERDPERFKPREAIPMPPGAPI